MYYLPQCHDTRVSAKQLNFVLVKYRENAEMQYSGVNRTKKHLNYPLVGDRRQRKVVGIQ